MATVYKSINLLPNACKAVCTQHAQKESVVRNRKNVCVEQKIQRTMH